MVYRGKYKKTYKAVVVCCRAPESVCLLALCMATVTHSWMTQALGVWGTDCVLTPEGYSHGSVNHIFQTGSMLLLKTGSVLRAGCRRTISYEALTSIPMESRANVRDNKRSHYCNPCSISCSCATQWSDSRMISNVCMAWYIHAHIQAGPSWLAG